MKLMRNDGDINKAQQVDINKLRGSGSEDDAPDSHIMYLNGFHICEYVWINK